MQFQASRAATRAAGAALAALLTFPSAALAAAAGASEGAVAPSVVVAPAGAESAPAAAAVAAPSPAAAAEPAAASAPDDALAQSAPDSTAAAIAALPPGSREWSYALGGARELELHTTAGSVRVVVGADDRVRVHGGHRDRDEPPQVSYTVRRGVGELAVRGHDELELVVEVPRTLALAVRMTAGELEVGRIEGDLDLRLRAGRVTIDAADAAEYADIDVSVVTGEIVWDAANVRHGGLFRSYDRSGTGRAKLRVRVLAGSVDIV